MRTMLGVAVCLLLAGCSSTIFRTYQVESARPTVISIDAKQRLAFMVDKPDEHGRTIKVVCTEPSPDAIVGVSAALGLDVPFHGSKIGLDTSMAEAVAQMGTRTQTIQLLRDGLYRACEAYINGILTRDDYELMLRHYDMTMVMLVAIDGLTRGCAHPVAISGESSVAAAADKSPSTTSKSTVSSTPETTSCPVSDKVAEEVTKIIGLFIDMKKPLHEQACIAQALARLQGEDKTPPDVGQLQRRVAAARDICTLTVTVRK